MMFETLEKSKIFLNLSAKEIENDLEKIKYKVKKYSKGDLIYHATEKLNDLVIIIKGSVSTQMMSFSGKSLNMSILKSPNPIAEAVMYSSKKQLPVSVEAVEEVELLIINKDELQKLFFINSVIMENYIQSISDRAVALTQKIFMLSLKTIKGKIALYIMRQSKGKDSFEMKHSQKDLAALFGIARPSLARELKQLSDEGIIEINRREVKIIDKFALQDLVE